MKIGIDARPFKYKDFSGIPGSIFEVLKRWMEQDYENEFYLISNTEINLPCTLPCNWKRVIVPSLTGNGTLWQIFRLKGIIRRLGLDWFWGTNFMLPDRVSGCRYLLTVHDLAFEIMPEVVSKKTLYILKIFCRKSCKRADRIHAVSQCTKNDIANIYGIERKKIDVVYWGVDEKEKAVECAAKRPDYRFLLFLGTLEPRKNIEIIVKAFNKFKEADDKGIHIVFAGKYGWKYEHFNNLVDNSEYRDYIHVFNYVDEQTKEMLLKNAEMLLYPSLYEGFGLPILEAYQHSLFVLTANNSAIPEVAGEAAFYVEDAKDYKKMADIVSGILDMDKFRANRQIELMNGQLKKFSWKRSAVEIKNILGI